MTVSVIIPNYNHERYLTKRIDSVLQQTYPNFEVFILDDKSTDNSKSVIEAYRNHPKVKGIFYNEVNSGSVFRQWQKGISLATGEYMWIAESDDYADPTFLEKLVVLTKQYEHVGIAYANSHWVDDTGNIGKSLSIYKESFFRKGQAEINNLLYYNTIQNVSSAIIKTELARKAIDGIGAFKACGDWLFYIKVLEHSNVAYTAEPLNYFRWYHNNVSNKAAKDGVWITEGTRLLSNLNAKHISVGKKQLYGVSREWLKRIVSFKDFSALTKMKAMGHLFIFCSKFLFSR